MSTPVERRVTVTVAYGSANSLFQREVTLPKGATVERAIHASALLPQYPEIDLSTNKVGIFSKIVALDTLLQTGDRIEVYQPAQGKRKKGE